MLQGRCRDCSSKISFRYPIVELLTGILFVLFFLKFGLEKNYFLYIILIGYMIVLTFIDIDKKEIPDGIVVLLFVTGFILNTLELNKDINIFAGVIGALAAGFIIYLMNFFTNGKIGEGDVKLFAALGLCLGLQAVTELILWSFITGGIISVILVLAKKYKRTDKIAFVPFIALALLIQGLIL
jgi:leader peptidase (prepilin peptidase)/N-methyltransferase